MENGHTRKSPCSGPRGPEGGNRRPTIDRGLRGTEIGGQRDAILSKILRLAPWIKGMPKGGIGGDAIGMET